jgi:DNA-binding NarL/FixJ family response regulator
MTAPTPVRVLIVDDHSIVREGLRTLLSEEAEIEVVGEAANGAEAVKLVATRHPHVVLMDLLMPEVDGIEAIRRIRARKYACEILVLTSFGDDQHVRDAIQAGATGYLLKDVLKVDLLRAIHAAARGEPTLHPEAQRVLIRQTTAPSPFKDLTERELDVLRLIAQGRSNREIALTLHLTEGTVKGYVSTVLDKLRVDDRTQAALFAVRHKLVVDG